MYIYIYIYMWLKFEMLYRNKYQNMFGMTTIAVSPKPNQSKTTYNADT